VFDSLSSRAGPISPDFLTDDLIEIKLHEVCSWTPPCSLSAFDFEEDQNVGRYLPLWLAGLRRCPMRFYFDIRDRLAIRDEVGRDFKLVSDAVVYARYLAADLRCLEPNIRPQLSIQVISEDREPIHEEAVFA
jgi:hypothetical protein